MTYTFQNCTSLTNLDISSFNTSKTTNLTNMMSGCSSLKSMNLGSSFSFKGASTSTSYYATPPTPSSTFPYTGNWIKIDGTAGPYTAANLKTNYNGSTMSGEWVWEGEPELCYTVNFNAPEGATGSMTSQNLLAAGLGKLKANSFSMSGKVFRYWIEGVHRYDNQASIPANTYSVGDIINLTAEFCIAKGTYNTVTWEIDNDGVLHMYPTNGESGVLTSTTSSSSWPWYSYRTQVTSVAIDNGVATAAAAAYMFYGMTKCTEMDLSALDTSAVLGA